MSVQLDCRWCSVIRARGTSHHCTHACYTNHSAEDIGSSTLSPHALSATALFFIIVSITSLTACQRVERSDYSESLDTADAVQGLPKTRIADYPPANPGETALSAHRHTDFLLPDAWQEGLNALQSAKALAPCLTDHGAPMQPILRY